jgi:hypothetical protein
MHMLTKIPWGVLMLSHEVESAYIDILNPLKVVLAHQEVEADLKRVLCFVDL